METVWQGVLPGSFYGYKPGRVYELSDSTKWEQEDGTDEPVYCQHPTARLLNCPGMSGLYLDVEGAPVMVRVRKHGAEFRTNAGAV